MHFKFSSCCNLSCSSKYNFIFRKILIEERKTNWGSNPHRTNLTEENHQLSPKFYKTFEFYKTRPHIKLIFHYFWLLCCNLFVRSVEYNSNIYAEWFPLAIRNNRKKLLNQLNEALIDFIIGNDNHAGTIENENLEPQTNGLGNRFGRSTVGESSTKIRLNCWMKCCWQIYKWVWQCC